MEAILSEFLKSEKSLYLFTGIIGLSSILIGLLFFLYSNHKSFAITMFIIGVIEIIAMFPAYINYQEKIDTKTEELIHDSKSFIVSETLESKKALKSFFWLKLIYGILFIGFVASMSFINPKVFIFGVFTALILHLALAITIDNFGEKYTKKYLDELIIQVD